MDDQHLRDLAEMAGVATHWHSTEGQEFQVAPETLRRVLAALGLPEDIAEARWLLAERDARLPPLLTMRCGPDGVAVPGATPGHRFRLDLEHGGTIEGQLETGWSGEARLPALDQPGYHRLSFDDRQTVVAAAPERCFTLEDAGAELHRGALPWAMAVQIHSLRRRGDLGIGDFGGVAAFAESAARHGAAGVAISPAHALFAADPAKYGPYAPSSRLYLNTLLADPAAAFGPQPEAAEPEAGLIDWPAAAARKLVRLRRLFERHADDPRFVAFRNAEGTPLEDHARFEALHAYHFAQDPALWHWRSWPEEHRSPHGPGVQQFAREHAREVAFHAFCQGLAEESRAAAQRAARGAGMPLGLIADLAIGTDGGGSHAWARQQEIIPGLSVGAPPDGFSPLGQDWGLTAFSPLEMRHAGFVAFIEVLRASMRHAGGVRVDHVMGLRRLWLVPHGARPTEGAYVRYPFEDMLRLLQLESLRHRTIVIGEDLGTLPLDFTGQMQRSGMMGMRVLWFERDWERRFLPPSGWLREAVAMTTTHDLPTVLGWWRGRDIAWRQRLDLFPSPEIGEAEAERREADRALLLSAMEESGVAPARPEPEAVVEAALAHVASAGCALALLPLEDALAQEEQPNLPGTVDAHPNWRRRLPGEAATMLDAPPVARRLERFAAARARPVA